MIGVDRDTGASVGGIDHLRQSIRDILTTRIGTRVMRRAYGSDIPNLIDRPMTPLLAIDFYAATAIALDRWEPRVRLDRIELTDARPGRVELSMECLYMPEGREITVDGIIVE